MTGAPLHAHATPQEDKLVLLDALARLGGCTQEQLLRFAVETGLQEPFPFLLALSELKEAAQVREVRRPEGALLVLTPEGRQSLDLFGDQIRAAQREKLAKNAPAWRERIREEQQLPATFEETESGYTVTLRALEAGEEIACLTLTAATRAQAQRFCARWPSRAPEIYRTIMAQLGEDEQAEEQPNDDGAKAE